LRSSSGTPEPSKAFHRHVGIARDAETCDETDRMMAAPRVFNTLVAYINTLMLDFASTDDGPPVMVVLRCGLMRHAASG
jgi:hypothetical protein